MDSATNAVLRFVNDCLQQQQSCWLVTVVKTWGSAPRLPGACFAWSKNKGQCGSLSGGCIEQDLVEQLSQNSFADQLTPFFKTYGISSEEAQRFGLPCGGRLELLVEYIPAVPSQQTHFNRIQHCLAERQGMLRCVNLKTPFESPQVSRLQPAKPQQLSITNEQVCYYLGPQYRLIILGANQTAQYLADFSNTLNFDVWVCDPRENAFADWPDCATETISSMPDDLIREHGQDPFTAIVALAHDPRVDDMGLMEALRGDAFYIGAMGSKKSTQARIKRLQQLDLSQAQIDKLIAPIGLPIGSKTPAEIAMAVAADLVRFIRQP